ncbi:uncharacterized protein LOC142563613 isoform X2 [Dermacentor variabilis]|uniref:uncharacterized protein LOC142563613 isoform X2 n=1 Tax=Dermacentor variabilis TaxID=34621 RepID=UPI003F5B4AA2
MELFMKTIMHLSFLVLFQSIVTPTFAEGVNGKEPIGQNITVKVQAYYDDSFRNNTNETLVKAHFDDIFSKIRQILNGRQVMLNFTVEKAGLMNNLTVNDTTRRWRQINGNATLENLKNFADAQKPSRETMFYYFTSASIAENGTYRADYVFTPNTFCTTSVTATVLQSLLGPEFYQTALKETIFMLLGRNTQRFSVQDFQKMNQTFWKCLNEQEK